ncbi:uncharacterized protein EV422DRAFT_336670 [Fimicolochytrium jonesii]|uniref:uncharacterized protein n=1 Tax=Fimicolochytrium jonesii TaxID=1396493 RepID=UPI0022FE491E|nr:uncharacterized protein EV422DRAFT_336670 [Fimicolochytrium jonesii]KAI8815944.1 hypothetical protein EV422DRAFT_336670 [Fimicolochytrium jonesii]
MVSTVTGAVPPLTSLPPIVERRRSDSSSKSKLHNSIYDGLPSAHHPASELWDNGHSASDKKHLASREPYLRRSLSRTGPVQLGLGFDHFGSPGVANLRLGRTRSQNSLVGGPSLARMQKPDVAVVNAAGNDEKDSNGMLLQDANETTRPASSPPSQSRLKWLKSAGIEPQARRSSDDLAKSEASSSGPLQQDITHTPHQPTTERPTSRPTSRRSVITKPLPPHDPITETDASVNSNATSPQLRRKRGGWWDGTADRENEIQRVKDMVRQNIHARSGSERSGSTGEDGLGNGVADCMVESNGASSMIEETPDVGGLGTDEAGKCEDTGNRAARLRKRNSSVLMKSILSGNDAVEATDSQRDVITGNSHPRKISTGADFEPQTRGPRKEQQLLSPSASAPTKVDRSAAKVSHSRPARNGHSRGEASTGMGSTRPGSIALAAEHSPPDTTDDTNISDPCDAAALSAALNREQELKAQIAALEQQLQNLRTSSHTPLQALTHLPSPETAPPVPPHLVALILTDQAQTAGLANVVLALCREKGTIGNVSRGLVLRRHLDARRMGEAVQLVRDVAKSKSPVKDTDEQHKAAFEDLAFVLAKYWFIHLVQCDDTPTAQKVLDTLLKPKVEREVAGASKGRGEWFAKDLGLLLELLSEQGDKETNPYVDLQWYDELTTFWEAGKRWRRLYVSNSSGTQPMAGEEVPPDRSSEPLFARALGEFFMDDEVGEEDEEIRLESVVLASRNWRRARKLLDEMEEGHAGDGHRSLGPPLEKAVSRESTADAEIGTVNGVNHKGTARSRKKSSKQLPKQEEGANGSARVPTADELPDLLTTPPKNSRGVKRTSPGAAPAASHAQAQASASPAKKNDTQHDGSGPKNRRRSTQGEGKPPRDTHDTQSAADPDRHSTHTSHSHSFLKDPDADLPPPPTHLSSADFALSTTCGPVLNEIRALDVTSVSKTGQIVAATAGSHDRSDKRISIWDARTGSLLTQLENGTSKPVTCLVFHPESPYLLLSADMEFDVKLWDWRTGTVLRTWKKLHTRIIFRVSVVPGGDYDRAATCSGDQSIKIFSIEETNGAVESSVHANEPFTSFVFVGNAGEPNQMNLVASLSYSIRIYRVRTTTLLHTIQLGDLKANKTPITSLTPHPTHPTYLLICCDNQLRLFNLLTASTVKIYQSRSIPAGIRVDGAFSPCGGWVYCGTWDVKGRIKRDNHVEGTGAEAARRSSNGGGMTGGVVVWKVHTGRVEKLDCGVDVNVCRWIEARELKKGGGVLVRKVLVAAGLDRVVRVYM